MTPRLFVLVLLFHLITHNTAGQELVVRGGFLTDSIRIGDVTRYALSARYPSELNILFPDSTTNSYPFEFQKRVYFPTQTRQGISTDSVIYYLSTFEPDSVQYLSLPVYVVHPMDCTAVYPEPDSLMLKALIGRLPDSVALHNLLLKENLAFQDIPTPFTGVVMLFVFGSLMLIGAAVYGLFGDRISRHYRLVRLRKNHSKFLQGYSDNLSRLRQGASPVIAESTVGMWKKYLENLELRPYTKLTTKETIQLLNDETIRNSLQNIDRSIYGNQAVKVQAFEGLRDFAQTKFQQKLEEVMHE